MAKPTTEAVLQHHNRAFDSGDLDELLEDYTADSVLITPDGSLRGQKKISEVFALMLDPMTIEDRANLKRTKIEICGEYACVLISMPPVIPFAGDVYHIHNGKILMQAILYNPEDLPKS